MTATTAGGTRFVGRTTELAEFREWLTDAQAGHGRLTVLRGDPGMGKTRLAEELARDARSLAIPVVWGRCSADSGAPPLWPLRRIADELPGQHGTLPTADSEGYGRSAEGSAAARFAQFVWFSDAVVTASRADGLLVFVEDLHWADSATAAALSHLAAEIADSRALVVVTARLRAEPESTSLASLLARPGVEQRVLAALGRGEVADYLRAVEGGPVDERYADLVLRQTAGNILFVGAVSRLLHERVSLRSYEAAHARAALAGRPELLDLIREPMSRVSPRCREMVEAASVAGEEFDLVDIAEVCGMPVQMLVGLVDEAVQAGLLTRPADSPGTVRFVHVLVREGVYDSVDSAVRARAHRCLAAAIVATGSGPERIGRVATHLTRGAATPAEHEHAAVAARRAGQAAMAELAFVEAARQFGSALHSSAMAGGIPPTDRAALLLDLALAEYRSGAFGHSMEHSLLAADLAEPQQHWALLARAALLVDGVSVPEGADAVVALCQRALAMLPETEVSVRAQLQARLAYAAVERGDLSSAQEMSAVALGLAEQTGDPPALIAALRARHQALSGPGYALERQRLGGAAIALADKGEPLAALWGRSWRVDAAFELGDIVAVDQELTALALLADALRFPLARWHLHRLQAAREALVGRFVQAQEQARTAHLIAGQVDDQSVRVLYFAFQLFLLYTRADAANGDRRDAEVADFLVHARRIPLPIAHACVGLAMISAGDHDEAARIARRLTADLPTWPLDGRWIVTVTMLSDLLADVVERSGAELVYPLLVPFAHLMVAGGSGTVACEGSVSRRLGRLAMSLDRLELAETHLRDAIKAEDRMGARPFAALSRMYLARTLHRRGGSRNLAEAAQLARTALAAMRAMDMPGRAAQCERVAAAIGADVAAATTLTAREREIVARIAEGLSNRQIAERLFVSERTVETHVSHVLAKLGGSSRTDIATWAVAGGLHSEPG